MSNFRTSTVSVSARGGGRGKGEKGEVAVRQSQRQQCLLQTCSSFLVAVVSCPLPFLVGYVVRAQVVHLVSCDHAQVNVAARPLGTQEQRQVKLCAPFGDRGGDSPSR